MNVVIGSGPSGIATALRLLANSQRVLMLDSGFTVSETTSNTKEVFKKNVLERNFNKLDAQLSNSKNRDIRLKSHLGSKLYFGSDFAYADENSINNTWEKYDIAPRYSLAMGGLSRVWGAISFRLSVADQKKLGADLDKYYNFIERFMNISGSDDDLSLVYQKPEILSQSPNSESFFKQQLLEKYNRNKKWFLVNRIICGDTRVAVKTVGMGKCVYCGYCTTGCAFDSIWCAEEVLEFLIKNPNFKYIKTRVSKCDFKNKEVLDTNFQKFSYTRLFIAAGAISTANLILKSSVKCNSLTVEDTQLNLIPLFSLKKQKRENIGFTLSKFALVLLNKNKSVASYVQITGYSPDFVSRLQQIYPIAQLFPTSLLNWFLCHISVAFYFQDSSKSGRLIFEQSDNGFTSAKFDNLKLVNIKKLSEFKSIKKALRKIGFIPLTFLLKRVGVGESYHFGATRYTDSNLPLTIDGRLLNEPDVYITDSTSLKSIVPGPITLTVMANAARIVDQSLSI